MLATSKIQDGGFCFQDSRQIEPNFEDLHESIAKMMIEGQNLHTYKGSLFQTKMLAKTKIQDDGFPPKILPL